MKRIFVFAAIAIAIGITGCEKTTVDRIIDQTKQNPAPDFWLRLSRTNQQGNTGVQSERALNQPGTATLSAAYYGKENKLHLRIGGVQTTTVLPRLSVQVQFRFAKQAAQVAGTYTFPADNDRVELYLTETVNGVAVTRTSPIRGTLQVAYDTTTGTLSGTFDAIGYNEPLNSLYVSETLNGTFNHVGEGQP